MNESSVVVGPWLTSASTRSGRPSPAPQTAVEQLAHLIGESRREHAENLELRRELEARSAIDRAAGILMGHFHLNADQADRLLCCWSAQTDVDVRILTIVLIELAIRDPESVGMDWFRTPSLEAAHAEVIGHGC